MLHSAPAQKPLACSFLQVCDALPMALLVLDADSHIFYANPAAEALLDVSSAMLVATPLSQWLALDSHWLGLLTGAAQFSEGAKERGLILKRLKKGEAEIKVTAHARQAYPFEDTSLPGIILSLEPAALSSKLDSHAAQREAMRSAAVMADILAHEVRNPLAGIRGAAQLLKDTASEDDQELLSLICSEVDRIGGLLGQVEYFSTERPLEAEAVNIHEILRYVRDVLQQGVGAHIRFVEQYDPSLPPVSGNRDLLVQAFLNLAKNAAEAMGDSGGDVTFITRYRGGLRLAGAEGQEPRSLPICIQIRDSGPGIAEDIATHIFEPFVTVKPSGKGLGLPVVSKIVADHGGVVELETGAPGQTTFAVLLPAWKGV